MQLKEFCCFIGIIVIVMLSLVACQNGENSANSVETISPISPPAYSAEELGACPNGCLDPSPDCQIKGIVTGMGEWLYYLPGSDGYFDALVTTKYGGRWFCTEAAAIVNNYQKAGD